MKSITHTSGFSKDRFFQLIKRTLVLNQKKWGIALAGGFGTLLLLVLIINTSHTQGRQFVVSIGLILYQFGGYILTAGIFSELNSKSSSPQLFTLPATTFEKFFTAWFLSYFVYTVIVIGLLTLLSMFLGLNPTLLSLPVTDQNLSISNVNMLEKVISFTVYHSIFLLGAAYFKSYNFLKTVLAIVITFAIFIIFLWNLLFEVLTGKHSYTYFNELSATPGELTLIVTLFKAGIAALFLFFSYRQLKNRQVA
ncbi:hypothetical protein DYD21_11890 [Rhodohalobacter sp. SW132]|uniref:hypothetical protein n=1 Tax=Rhodohalobacter sp. SW132 TaxID=2293433 RepID=UPI000E27C8EF|nr:hypothetical protein [Rhodohalobacter sp. SW132]REL33465.1 hypothetical protein DYD21_11890 [Rhodohalobacter sp. SW132]